MNLKKKNKNEILTQYAIIMLVTENSVKTKVTFFGKKTLSTFCVQYEIANFTLSSISFQLKFRFP